MATRSTTPLHMRREGFAPGPELAPLREEDGVRRVDPALNGPAWLVTRIADVRQVLGDPARFGNSPHHLVPGGPVMTALRAADGEPDYRSRQVVHGLASLPVTW
ncbi:hypothetical protein ACRAKI_27475 [Saccharothrix isguenensis]